MVNMANPQGGYAQPDAPLNPIPPSQRTGGVVRHGFPAIESESKPKRAGGVALALVGLTGMATLALIVCKISGLIDWPIAWVLSPSWIAGLGALFAILFGATVSGVVAAVKGK